VARSAHEEREDPKLPDALRRALDRLGRRTLAAVSRYAASRLGAMGGVEGGKKRWVGTTRAQRREAARKAVMVRWAKSERTAVRYFNG
jgi:hypothetical protein